jgi:hypothetical protein
MKTESCKSTSDKVQCIECKENISRAASICIHCSSFQKRWKNTLKYIASIIAIVVVTGTFLVWLVSMLPSIRKIICWKDDVRVIGLNSLGSTIVGNFGDGPIFLSHILVELPEIENKFRQRSHRIEFLKLLKPGEIAEKDTLKEEYGEIEFFQNSNFDDAKRKDLTTKAVRQKGCYRILSFIEEDPFFLDIKAQKRDPLSAPSKGYIAYYTSREDQIKKTEIDIISVIVKQDAISCKENTIK